MEQNRGDTTSRDTTVVPAAISELAGRLHKDLGDSGAGGSVKTHQSEYNEVYGKLAEADDKRTQSTRSSASKHTLNSPGEIGRSEVFGEDDEEMPMSPSSVGIAPSTPVPVEGGDVVKTDDDNDDVDDLKQGDYVVSPPQPPSLTSGSDSASVLASGEVSDLPQHLSMKKMQTTKGQNEQHYRRSKGSSSARRGQGAKKTHTSLGYSRIVKSRSKWQPFEDQDATVKKSGFSLMKDRIGSVMRGETSEERDLRLRLDWYRRALGGEVGVLQASLEIFQQRRVDGMTKLEKEVRALESQGLQPYAKYLQLQHWSVLDRYDIVESLTKVSLKAMESRLKRSSRVIELYHEEIASKREKKQQKHDLETFHNFCLNPEDVVSKEAPFVSLSKRLARMDRVVNNTRDSFLKLALPKISAPSFDRVPAVHALILTYDKIRAEKAPPAFNEADFSWEDICEWYVELQGQKLKTELTFMDIVVDERERNGRLFRQWVEFVLKEKRERGQTKGAAGAEGQSTRGRASSKGASGSSSLSSKEKEEAPSDSSKVLRTSAPSAGDKIAASVGLSASGKISGGAKTDGSGNGSGGHNGSTAVATVAAKELESVISPRSVLAFIKYYATIVLAADYGIKAENVPALKALTEAAVYRRVHSRTYRYTSVSLHARDLHWVYKCRLAKFVDPATFGIDKIYLSGPLLKKSGDANGVAEGKERKKEEKEARLKDDAKDIDVELAAIDAKYNSAALLSREVPTAGVPLEGDAPAELQCNHYGRPYARVSKLLSLMTTTVDPKLIADVLLLAVKWLMKEAVQISGKTDFLGADTVFPILVLSLVYADIPNVHLILQYLHHYAEISEASEASYYLTCLEAAVEYVIRLEVPKETVEMVRTEIQAGRIAPHNGLEDMDDVVTLEALTGGQQDYKTNEKSDLEDLGEWLREYQTMEDTISILTKEGIF